MFTAAGLSNRAPCPMIIAGGATADEAAAALWFQAASPATMQVWVAPGNPEHGHRARGLGSPCDQPPERGAQALIPASAGG